MSRSPWGRLVGAGLGLALALGATTTAPAGAGQAPPLVVVKLAAGCRIDDLAARVGLVVQTAIVPSRGIYEVTSTSPAYAGDLGSLLLVTLLELDPCVLYAEADQTVAVGDTHFHSWPSGDPTPVTLADWRDQAAARTLRLSEAHALSTGAGTVVAVLDTGVDPAHPVLAGHLTAGYDYVDDDADPTDEQEGVDSDGDGHLDGAYGHGTFVAGLSLLVAPDARVLPMRVLDSDGVGNVFAVAQAIDDAVAAGADVVNLSFGSRVDTRSQVLRDAIVYASDRGVAVVAAAGNDGSSQAHYPAAQAEVLSVAATEPDESALCDFSARGAWVDVAAPGRDLVGPLPGGLYADWSGTSMATPLVSGQVALLDSALGGPTSTAVRTVRRTAVKVAGIRVKKGVVDVLGSLTAVG